MFFSGLPALVVSLLVLGFASSRLVKELSGFSVFARVPKFLLAFVLLGLGTSVPDLFIAGFSSSRGELPLVIGSVIGANVLILTLLLGSIVFLKGGFRVREKTVLENFGWLFFVLMIPFFLLVDGKLTAIEGVILVIVYLMYVYNVTEQEAFFKKQRGVQTNLRYATEFAPKGYYKKHKFFEAFKVIALLAIVLVSADYAVSNAVALSKDFGVPEMFIGFSVVALGLVLPELAMDLSALKAKEEELIWGDVIGSFVTELTLVLGIAALFSGGDGVFSFEQTIVGYAFMVVSFLAVFFFAHKDKELTKIEGAALILLYLVFLSFQIDYFFFK